jgi:hypothetical protein
MGTSYAPLGAVRNLENVGKRMGADLLLNFREAPTGEVRRIPILGTWVNKGKKKRKDQSSQEPRSFVL